MPEIAKISVDYSRFGDFTDANERKSSKPVNALNLARYCLYDRDQIGFGLDNSNHLAYTGGFITQESKINTKYSNLQIKRSSTSNGNLSVSGTSVFFRGISLGRNSALEPTSTIKNARYLNNANELKSSSFDRDPVTIRDFKNFMYHPGMIILYNGTWEDVRDKMPFWRICALPDAGKAINTKTPDGVNITIEVPNLLGKFTPGGQPIDRHIGGEYEYKTGDTGGHDAVKLSVNQLPKHNHNVSIVLTGNEPPVFTGLGSFMYGGGELITTNGLARKCSFQSAAAPCGCTQDPKTDCTTTCTEYKKDDGKYVRTKEGNKICEKRATTNRCNKGSGVITETAALSVDSVTSLNIESYSFRTLKLTNLLPKIISETQQIIGADGQHENRPQFYGLVPIIYVGVKR